MSDLISRSELLEALEKEEKECEECMIIPSFSSALAVVELQPSVEPVRGEWIYTPTFNEYECSNCKSMIFLSDDVNAHPNFCPNCGADMRGEKND